jgi:hypothetical protein
LARAIRKSHAQTSPRSSEVPFLSHEFVLQKDASTSSGDLIPCVLAVESSDRFAFQAFALEKSATQEIEWPLGHGWLEHLLLHADPESFAVSEQVLLQ